MASRRFEGAVTTPADSGEIPDSTLAPVPERPHRPILIELSAAILIIGGITGLLGTVGYQLSGGSSGGVIGLLVLALNILTVVVGGLIRAGRAWVLAINVVAIALFLEVTALPATFAIIYVVLDSIVLYALFRHRGWFFWRPEDAAT